MASVQVWVVDTTVATATQRLQSAELLSEALGRCSSDILRRRCAPVSSHRMAMATTTQQRLIVKQTTA